MTESSHSGHSANAGHVEYDRLFSYFRYLVAITIGSITIILTAAGIFFYSNLRDVRADAKEEANRVATAEAKARVAEAFNEKNVNQMILQAAQDKVGTVTDKLIQQQLESRLGPIQQKISFMGQISESDMRMRMGFRGGMDDLNRLLKSTNDPDVLKFANTTMTAVGQDYDTRMQENANRFGGQALFALQNTPVLAFAGQSPANLHDVVQVIAQNPELNTVATAFIAFRQISGENVKMFDSAAVTSWCSRNKPKCEASDKPAPSPMSK
jgi:hypothetical protein